MNCGSATTTASGGVVLVGTPNVGKSVIFGILTGQYVTVSNYPGTTVEVARGETSIQGKTITVTDTPGVNNLIPMSADECVTRDILLEGTPRTVIQICDAKNLKQALFITLQIAEMGLPSVMAINMWDEALERRIRIDLEKMTKILGVPIFSTVATHRKGTSALAAGVVSARPSVMKPSYDRPIEEAVRQLTPLLPVEASKRRSVALMLLAGDDTIFDWLRDRSAAIETDAIEGIITETQAKYSRPLGYVINEARQKAAEKIFAEVVVSERSRPSGFAEILGRWSTHPVGGIPILLASLVFMWYVVGVIGAGDAVDFMENTLFAEYLLPALTSALEWLSLPEGIMDLLVGPFGVISMGLTYGLAIVFPVVIFFFICFGLLEDSGYLPRLAIMSDRIFKVMGLNGKAVLPMVLGLGCGTMATMTTRILETKRERIIVTLLLALGVPCSAQLAVIMGLVNPLTAAGMIWFGVMLGVILMVGFAASRVLPGKRPDFLLEIPPMRIPKLGNILYKTFARLQWYLKEALPLFVLATAMLFISDRIVIGDTSILGWTERIAAPVVVGLLGLPAAAAACFILGFLRRDYGAAGLFAMWENGLLNRNQVVVSLVVVTLFIPCVAQFMVMVKERGMKGALLITGFVVTFAVAVGAALNLFFNVTGIMLS